MIKEFDGILHTDYPEEPWVVYSLTSQDGSDNSIYVGVTENHIQRVKSHSSLKGTTKKNKNIKLYAWIDDTIKNNLKVLFKILYRYRDEEEALNKEIELVKYYREKGHNVLNITDGGRGRKGTSSWIKGRKLSKEIRDKLSKAQMGIQKGWKKPRSEEAKQSISLGLKKRKEKGLFSPKRKIVYKYNKDGNLLNVYSSLGEASKNEPFCAASVGEWCRGEKIPENEFIWSYKELLN